MRLMRPVVTDFFSMVPHGWNTTPMHANSAWHSWQHLSRFAVLSGPRRSPVTEQPLRSVGCVLVDKTFVFSTSSQDTRPAPPAPPTVATSPSGVCALSSPELAPPPPLSPSASSEAKAESDMESEMSPAASASAFASAASCIYGGVSAKRMREGEGSECGGDASEASEEGHRPMRA